ncbi:hypothetical protein CEE45_04825 [Candidatus Heimdallarchaeota archaeon B3_Heim]|nr:MAG: hypothetical protein CEE45_04825 [Candidatus Heimdallarchaeota archaeon B3_Heim]
MDLLEYLGIKYFKGIVEANIELKPITILIGANGSGKSSIGQAMLLLKQSLESETLVIDGENIRFGELEDVFFNRDQTIPIEFTLKGRKKKLQYEEEITISNGKISYFAELKIPPYGIIKGSDAKVNPEQLHYSKNTRISISPTKKFGKPFDITSSSSSGEERRVLNQTRRELSSSFSIIEDDLFPLWYVPSIRGTLKPFEFLEDNPVENLLTPSNERFEIINSKWISTLAYKPEILEIVSSWCNQILKKPLKDKLFPGKKITLESVKQVDRKKREQIPNISILNEGFGLNQLAFLLTQLALASPESIIIIEEPEIHLHPRAQSKLIEVFIREALDCNKRLLITTHSEHIVYHALTKIGLGELKKHELALYHFKDDRNGCYGKELEFDKNGRLKEGLPDFFEANIEQYKRYIDVLVGVKPEGKENDREKLHT